MPKSSNPVSARPRTNKNEERNLQREKYQLKFFEFPTSYSSKMVRWLVLRGPRQTAPVTSCEQPRPYLSFEGHFNYKKGLYSNFKVKFGMYLCQLPFENHPNTVKLPLRIITDSRPNQNILPWGEFSSTYTQVMKHSLASQRANNL